MKGKAFFIRALVLTLLVCPGFFAYGQMVGTNIFLQGNYLEIGIQDNGAFGACSGVPASYHPHTTIAGGGTQLAAVYDQGHDGWTVGSPPYMGDYTYAGTTFEGWSIQAAGLKTDAFQTCPSGSFSGSLGLTGSNVSYSSVVGTSRANWAGTAMGGQLVMNMQTRVDANDSWVLITVKLRNAGSTPIPGVYFMRACDPDTNQSWPAGGFPTNNQVWYQNDTAHRVMILASQSTGPTAKLWLGTKDSRAKVFTYNSVPTPPLLNLADVYNESVPAGLGVFYYDFLNHPGDMSIGIVFDIGTIPPGDSTNLSYAYLFSSSGAIDTAFPAACSGLPVAGTVTANTPIACASTGISLTTNGGSLSSGLDFQWQSSTDSAVWNDIPGALSNSYTFSGLTSTAFFRCKVTCASSGLYAFTPGRKITYSVACPCLHSAGILIPSTSSACSTTVITLDNFGYTSGPVVALQWQSSTDSITWSDIAGATSVPFTFSGLGVTNWYRLKSTCIATGVIATSDIRKVIYTPLCGCIGTPVGGTANASTSYCSGCTFTLDLTGISPLSGTSYQWELSATGSSAWSNVVGATSMSYNHSPIGSYYYRCKSTCSASGVSAYSSSVYVGYHYAFIADSAGTSPDTVCTAARLFSQINGYSPLLRIKTYYGDGQKDSLPVSVSGGTFYTSSVHSYATPGSYLVKRVLYENNMPQDSVVRTYEHLFCRVLPIKLHLDSDGNCFKSTTEPFNTIPVKIQVDSNGVNIDTFSVTSGLFYKATGPAGTIYNFRVLPGSRFVSCPASGVISFTLTPTVNTYSTQNFALSCGSGSLSDLAVHVVVPVTGRRDQWGHIYVSNNYCVATDATLGFRYSFKYSGDRNWNMAPSAVLFPTASWTLPAVTSLGSRKDIYFAVWAPSSAFLTAGDTVTEEITVTPNFGTDCETSNNIIIRVDTVKASCDPNMIEVTPAGCFDTATNFQFTVHFENTGNDTAYNVYVLDTLSDYLDPSSMNLVMSSAEVMNIYPYTEGGYNIVKFDFPNIKLLDSSWKGLNDGAFIYTIRRRAGMPEGASIFSRVGIYFDYNEVVMTNTVQNLKGCPVTAVAGTASRPQVLLYPNPVTDELTIKTTSGEFASFAISNIVGVQLATGVVDNEVTRTHTAHLPPGVYYVTLRGAAGTEVRKFVKR